MGTGQMMLVLFSVILFSTITLNVYNGMYYELHQLSDQFIRLQTRRIADKFIQKIGSELLGGAYSFDDAQAQVALLPATETITHRLSAQPGGMPERNLNHIYNITYSFGASDSTGVPLSPQPNPYDAGDFQFLIITVSTTGSGSGATVKAISYADTCAFVRVEEE